METELISSQLAVAYATSSLLEWLKGKSWFPLVNANTSSINRLVAIGTAFVAAIGVHLVSDWNQAEGVLVITINGLTVANIAHGLIAWIQQYAMQQGSYKLLIKDK